MKSKSFVLASSSPRRRMLLEQFGFELTVTAADIDETPWPSENPFQYVLRVATGKAEKISFQYPNQVVLAADTTVVVDGMIVGKPEDEDDAKKMLRMLSGRTHLVHTAVVAIRNNDQESIVVTSEVDFADITPEMIDWYVATGDPLDKAGAYGLQGPSGALLSGGARKRLQHHRASIE